MIRGRDSKESKKLLEDANLALGKDLSSCIHDRTKDNKMVRMQERKKAGSSHVKQANRKENCREKDTVKNSRDSWEKGIAKHRFV